ncbi:hypothetical protein [Thiocapsa roseopersicina]|uniref:Uncharacterized protein n=1 Tax=Thiocapsa roseopersicina TaxID=1058 RepID=A0A1H3CZE0_THIRO|nr:hypothetical protein [Thiocapsa roseopersicina]SDX59436.1 hypothetical protein SAMN05421783_1407 [Thiocapsa roseopersicina]
MYRMIAYSVLFSLVLIPISAFSGWFTPSDYDECIIGGMKGVQSDFAARMVRQSCLEKFPPEKEERPESVEMPLEAAAKLSVLGGGDYFGDFVGTIYNGNSDWTVTEFTISILELIVARGSKGEINPFESVSEDRKYRIEIDVPPYTKREFSLSVDWPGNVPYKGDVYEARGYENLYPR